ncbi:hypothetical protein LTV02_26375 [Nocardia yamanashiensis]|uniref:nSTAND1 domain-containing NTPase n=1 Tax=Nocardia yamanashiensis TaxID=209247 RepID=UPI001E3EDC09|nr:hypothetical protein [Nocardia yamanashiensis]UGT39572.1 hypothetical protein LTV02_26375 [Nocardia yamanashiensis]
MLAGDRTHSADGDEIRILSPRALFAQRFAELYAAAGNPTLRRVAAATEARMRAAQGNRAGAASAQRISDWKAGRNVPARFESLLPVVLTLVEAARKGGAALPRELADPQGWQRLWRAATTWDPEEEAESACPYLGLAAYERADRALFFGRDRAVGELVELVGGASGIVVVVGASGAGKSSLLAAGVGVAMAARRVIGITPGEQPRARLAQALAESGEDADRLLIVDQFEELFSVCADDAERQGFLAELNEIACRADDPVGVLVALRADFYAQCLNYPVLRDALEQRSYPLGPLSPDELALAISGPARAVGMELEAGLEELIVSELRGAGDHHDDRAYDPGALPLLSHVMAATWQHREGRRLTIAGYRKAGGVVGAVAETAERTWSELSPAQQAAAQEILLGLVAVGQDSRDTRRQADRAELLRRAADPEDVTAALEVLARARLITLDADLVTLTHEIVLSAWPRLRGWIDEDRVGYLMRQRLETDAAEWAAQDRDPSLCYRGTRLRNAGEVLDRRSIGPLAAEFLAASEAAAARTGRRSARAKAASALLGVILLITGFAAYSQNRIADQRRTDQDFAAVLTAADQVQDSDPSLAAQLNLIAWRMRPDSTAVRSKLLLTQSNPLVSVTAAHSRQITKLIAQRGGSLLASLAEGGELRVWDRGDALRPRALGQPLRGVGDMAISANGRLLATVESEAVANRAITLWDLSTPATPRSLGTLPGLGEFGRARVEFAPDGRTLAVLTFSKLMFWDVSTPAAPVVRAIRPLPDQAALGTIGGIRFSPNGKLLALSDNSEHGRGVNQLWEVSDPAAPTIVAPELGAPFGVAEGALAFSPDGSVLAIGGGDDRIPPTGKQEPTVRLWAIGDPAHPRLLSALESPSYAISALDFAPDGDTLVTTGNRGSTLWNVTDPSAPAQLDSRLSMRPATCHFDRLTAPCTGGPSAVAFGADGHTVTAGGNSGDLQVWSLAPAVLSANSGWNPAPVFSGDGTRMVSHERDGASTLWDLGDPLHPTRIGSFPGRPAFSWLNTDGTRIIRSEFESQTLRVLDSSDPSRIRSLGEWRLPATETRGFIAFSNDYRSAVSADRDTLQLWNLADPTTPRPLGVRFAGDIDQQQPVFGPDGKTLVMRGTTLDAQHPEFVATLWDIADAGLPRQVAELVRQPAVQINFVAISPDGRTMVVTANEAVQVWDIGDPGRPVRLGAAITMHTLPIQPVGFSADSRTLVTIGVDGTVQQLDLADRSDPELVAVLRSTKSNSWTAMLAPDGRHLVMPAADGALRYWDLDEQHAIDRICATTGNMWTAELWKHYLPQLPYSPPCR